MTRSAVAACRSTPLWLVNNVVCRLMTSFQTTGVLTHLHEATQQEGAGAWSLQALLGYGFRFPVWVMGVPWGEAQSVGELMGLKTMEDFLMLILSDILKIEEMVLLQRQD